MTLTQDPQSLIFTLKTCHMTSWVGGLSSQEEGLKLTFQKHKLMANGVMGDGHPLFHKKKGNRKKLVEVSDRQSL